MEADAVSLWEAYDEDDEDCPGCVLDEDGEHEPDCPSWDEEE